MKKKIFAVILMLAVVFAMVIPADVSEASTGTETVFEIDKLHYNSDGHIDLSNRKNPITVKWEKKNGKWYLKNTKTKKYVTGFILTKKSDSYYFNEGGVMVSAKMFTYKGCNYYAQANGKIAKRAWKKINGYWYYFSSDGTAVKGWKTIDGKKYFFTNYYYEEQLDGRKIPEYSMAMAGPKYLTITWYSDCDTNYDYTFNANGKVRTGWIKDNIKNDNGSTRWYYCDKTGKRLTGWRMIDGKKYYFNKGGLMQTGWIKLSGKWYYLNGSGAAAINTKKKIGDRTYVFDKYGVCQNP